LGKRTLIKEILGELKLEAEGILTHLRIKISKYKVNLKNLEEIEVRFESLKRK